MISNCNTWNTARSHIISSLILNTDLWSTKMYSEFQVAKVSLKEYMSNFEFSTVPSVSLTPFSVLQHLETQWWNYQYCGHVCRQASQFNCLSIVCSIICSGQQQRNYQNFTLLVLCETNPPVTVPCDDVILDRNRAPSQYKDCLSRV